MKIYLPMIFDFKYPIFLIFLFSIQISSALQEAKHSTDSPDLKIAIDDGANRVDTLCKVSKYGVFRNILKCPHTQMVEAVSLAHQGDLEGSLALYMTLDKYTQNSL